jgi:hypothetical protein
MHSTANSGRLHSSLRYTHVTLQQWGVKIGILSMVAGNSLNLAPKQEGLQGLSLPNKLFQFNEGAPVRDAF